jgi:acyl-CoA synthetase (NDP forming)
VSPDAGPLGGPPLRDVPLDLFFHPRTVAVIGASGNRKSGPNLLYRTVKRKVEHDGGTVYPVNPNRTDIEGVPCYPSIDDVPGDLDLVVILSGNAVEALEQAVRRKPRFVMMFAAGFAESGEEGARQQEHVARLVRESGVFLLGPNTTLNAFLPLRDDLTGNKIALISHSGHQGRHLWEGQEIGIPLGYWAPTGNEVDLEFADFVKFFADQPEIGAIAGYIEGFKDGRTVIRAADYALAHRTPIVLVKVGRTAAGESTAISHTAHLAGSDAVADAVFRQYGISRVDSIDELLHVTAFLGRTPAPTAPGVCLYSISGGTLAHLTDMMVAAGLSVPDLTPETQTALREWIPGYLRVSNPVDSGGAPSGDERGPKILRAILDDPNVGVLVIPFVANAYHLSDAVVRDVVELVQHTDKPVCIIWGAPGGGEAAYRDVLVPSGIPVFRTFGQCLRALAAWFTHHELAARYESPFTTNPALSSSTADRGPVSPAGMTLPRQQTLSEHEAKQVLASYGVPVNREILVTTEAEAAAAGTEIGFPVVMKIASADIVHKSDLGLVEVGVPDAETAAQTFRRFVDVAASAAPDAHVDGVVVAELVRGGVECIVGVHHDQVFGPVVMFGLGGVLTEILGDVTFRTPPFTEAEAHVMLREVRGYPLLKGVRGQPPVDEDALVRAIMAVQDLVLAQGDVLAELDVNPLVAGPDGVVAVDAMLRTR